MVARTTRAAVSRQAVAPAVSSIRDGGDGGPARARGMSRTRSTSGSDMVVAFHAPQSRAPRTFTSTTAADLDAAVAETLPRAHEARAAGEPGDVEAAASPVLAELPAAAAAHWDMHSPISSSATAAAPRAAAMVDTLPMMPVFEGSTPVSAHVAVLGTGTAALPAGSGSSLSKAGPDGQTRLSDESDDLKRSARAQREYVVLVSTPSIGGATTPSQRGGRSGVMADSPVRFARALLDFDASEEGSFDALECGDGGGGGGGGGDGGFVAEANIAGDVLAVVCAGRGLWSAAGLFARLDADQLELSLLYEAASVARWRGHVRVALLWCVVVVGGYAAWDAASVLEGIVALGAANTRRFVVQYGVFGPGILLLLLLLRVLNFTARPAAYQGFCLCALLFIGSCVVALEFFNTSGLPDVGALSLYIVYSVHLLAVPFALRFVIASLLALAYIATAFVSTPALGVKQLMQQAGFLLIFVVGPAVEALLYEFGDRRNFIRQLCLKQLQVCDARVCASLWLRGGRCLWLRGGRCLWLRGERCLLFRGGRCLWLRDERCLLLRGGRCLWLRGGRCLWFRGGRCLWFRGGRCLLLRGERGSPRVPSGMCARTRECVRARGRVSGCVCMCVVGEGGCLAFAFCCVLPSAPFT